MQSFIQKIHFPTLDKLAVVVVLCLMVPASLKSEPLPSTFKNYRLSLGAGLGYSPLILMAPEPFDYMPWEKSKPMLKLEITLGPKHSFNFGYQSERYKFDIYPTFTHTGTSGSYEYIDGIQSQAKASMQSLTFDYRIYSTLIGGMAPAGRYIFYGFSINKTLFENAAISYTVPDQDNGSFDYHYPEHTFRTNTAGIRLGLGKKKYLGKKLKSFLEYQFLSDIKIGDFKTGLDKKSLQRGGSIESATYTTAMRLSQMTSLFQFTIHYGFSF